jgi:acetoin:2,6-dichlorophenolindophenol oxidoreductase subunit alpha
MASRTGAEMAAGTGAQSMMTDNELLIEAYRRMLRIRKFDEAAVAIHKRGEMAGTCHTSAGQEGEIVGACMALRPDDTMLGNHRSHGHPIGKGARLDRLMAELLGKETGVNRGKGGSMHLADFSVGSLGETSIVGSGIPVAAGAALGEKLQGTGRVCLCFFGDGAANEGAFHEGLNLAAVWELPVVYLCENNLYSVATYTSTVSSVEDVSTRAVGYGIPGVIVDGQDAVAVYDVVSTAVARAREGGGPSLVEAKTYRYDEHASGLMGMTSRPEAEVEYWRKRDPLDIHRGHLRSAGISEETADEVIGAVAAEVRDAVEFARKSPFPDVSEVFTHLYTPNP